MSDVKICNVKIDFIITNLQGRIRAFIRVSAYRCFQLNGRALILKRSPYYLKFEEKNFMVPHPRWAENIFKASQKLLI